MPRYKLTIEYHGAGLAGWQRQADLPTVQGVLEEAVRRFTGETVDVHGAGRTDAGVHATGQVAHVDLTKVWRGDTVRDALNAHLRPHRVSILAAGPVADDFDARRSAIARHYRYDVLARRPPAATLSGLVWHVARPLDGAAMHAAAQRLLGRHDFSTFRDSQCQAKSPIRTLDRLDVVAGPGEIISVHASARSFLHSQVRSLVGSLKLVGEGKWSADDLADALAAADRRRCGIVAPPDGLYLTAVDYPG
ncbi:tRNA pseudouridine(38-40) synthase TruA [Segnochrobactraceae bacterium EtOH-i3]